MTDWNSKRVVILGAARQGTALARYLVGQGAKVVLSDSQSAEKLKDALESLRDLTIEYALGSHPNSLLDNADVVCLSGGVPIDLPILIEAARRNITISNDSQIFFEIVPCKTLGITGSAGKTTTTTLTGKIVEASGRKVWIGGNIGNPLIADVDRMGKDDLAIIELSSFQLEQMTISPNIGAVLNITPNHLDRHGTMEAYINAKSHIVAYQKDDDIAVLGWDDGNARALQKIVRGRLWWFSQTHAENFGTYTRDGKIFLRDGEREQTVCDVSEIRLRGAHNVLNVLAACALTGAAGIKPEAMREAIANFNGVAHRLEFVREVRGAKWYNDSIATAPERVIAEIHSFDEPLIVLLGGRDKKLPWGDLLKLLRERQAKVFVFGEAGELIAKYAAQENLQVTKCNKMADALTAAARITQSGDVVLLSPGCTSFDEFKDFEERGRKFVEMVNQL
ncbi:MAG: UDP-N-acetylmuramoyl-L-alanine--D-glutamate ligase [Chloroflexi bacterium]|nr:UDP-N-acetylmuramoyl-L-alanine--D-glutamate ligase [Chloroflexota bacterium]